MTATRSSNPFPGLRPFRESEAHLFFGRGTHIDELLAELTRSRFVAVMGASGSGKSSLINAGLLPALHGGFSPRAGSRWRIATFRPGTNPIHNMACALAAPDVLGADDPEPVIGAAQVEATLRRSGLGLADAARRSAVIGDDRLLVVVDQFEELFRFHATDGEVGADAAPFVQLLIEATRDEAPVDVILTMRSDFLGDCSQFRDLPEAINDGIYLVPRLTRSQLREAITGPAAVGGATLSPRLVQRVLNDAGADPDLLPVVQHAMMRTWDTWVRDSGAVGPIDVEHYEACGALEAALSRHADEAYLGLAEGRPRLVAELMFKRITELGDDRRAVRRPTPLAEIAAVTGATPAEVEECIGHFEEQGRSFVTVSADGVVDISHESLIRQWPRLGAWVREEADSRDVYHRLADAADRWGRGEAALLQGPDLDMATQWWEHNQPNQVWADRYHPSFEAAARYLERSRSAARRRRAVVAASATLIVAAALLAVVALQLRSRAEAADARAARQERMADARGLAAASGEQGDAFRPVSMLTALEALRATEPDRLRLPGAEEALRQAMRDPVGVKLAADPALPAEAGPVRAAFSPDGALLATGGGDGTVRLWSVSSPDAEPRELDGREVALTELAFSPDGNWVAAGGEDGTVELWSVAAPGDPPHELSGHDAGITSLAFSPDGTSLATGSLDNTAIVWSVEDPAAPRRQLSDHRGFVLSLAFSPDGRRLVTGGGDDVALVWNLDDVGAAPMPLSGHTGDVTAVAFSPDGRSVATGSADGTARWWDLADGTVTAVLRHQGPVNTLAFSSDGRWLATGSGDRTARLWDLEDPAGPAARPVILKHDDVVDLVAFDASGRALATGSRDSTARLYDLDDLASEPVVLAGHDGPLESLAFGGDGRWLATGSDDGTARLWALDHPSIHPDVLRHRSSTDDDAVAVATVAFSPDGRRLATGASDKAVQLWDVDDLTALPLVLEHDIVPGFEKAGITALAFSSDGGRLATGSGDERVRLWDLDDAAADPTLRVLPDAVTALDFSPVGPLAIGVKDGDAFLWDVDDPNGPLQPLEGHGDEVTSVAFSPDGGWLATGSRDRTVRLWEPGDLASSHAPVDVGAPVLSLAYSAEGRQLAAGTSEGTVRVWNVDGRGNLSVAYDLDADVGQAEPAVNGVAFSADGQTLVVAAGSTLQLWDLGVPDPADPNVNPTVLRDHTGEVTAVAYSPDGLRFASASEDGTARVWLPLAAMVDVTCRDVGRNLTRPEWARFLPGEDYRKTCDEWPEGP